MQYAEERRITHYYYATTACLLQTSNPDLLLHFAQQRVTLLLSDAGKVGRNILSTYNMRLQTGEKRLPVSGVPLFQLI